MFVSVYILDIFCLVSSVQLLQRFCLRILPLLIFSMSGGSGKDFLFDVDVLSRCFLFNMHVSFIMLVHVFFLHQILLHYMCICILLNDM